MNVVRRSVVLLVALFACLLAVPVLAASATPTPVLPSSDPVEGQTATPIGTPIATDGSITGTVTNGTPKGGSVGGIAITLDHYQGTTQIQEWTSKTDANGKYSFTNLPVINNGSYLVTATYKKVPYQSDLVVLTKTRHSTADIKVYEPTTDPSVLQIEARGIVLSGTETQTSAIDAYEIITMTNTSQKAYVGKDGTVLTIPLPTNATQIIPQPGFDFGNPSLENGNFVTTGAIAPGSQNAMFAYLIPYQGTNASFDIRNNLKVGLVSVLFPDKSFKVTSASMAAAGPVTLGGKKFDVIAANNPVVNDVMQVNVTNLPKVGSNDSSHGALYAGIAAGVGVIAAGILIFQLLRRRRRLALAGAEGGLVEPLPPATDKERLELASELNQLDDDHARGEIDDESYQRERAELVEELREISRRMHGVEGIEGTED
ncbi:MAG TPA: carboxypeptidase regulatory-like domain-containing protein [Thermomicrobiaceae bacterium]|nr:carboxypeptidase regulatory-like domain-containing protein [Thermomicrobiaceae bacterium]